MGDLPNCSDDIESFKEAMRHYGVTDPDDCYEIHDTDFKTCNLVFRKMQQRLMSNPEVNHLILYVFAGHGMNVKGQQVLLLNEFD